MIAAAVFQQSMPRQKKPKKKTFTAKTKKTVNKRKKRGAK